MNVREHDDSSLQSDNDTIGAAGATSCEAEAEAAEEKIERLSKALAEAEARSKEYLDGWQRERASFANYRKRIEQERESLSLAGCAEAICEMLPVFDDLTRACDSMPDDIAAHPWANGICLAVRKFEQALDRLGVQPIEAKGCHFDPRIHEAVTYEEAEGCEAGEVIGEVERGFKMGDRILRCSRVRVARGKNEAD